MFLPGRSLGQIEQGGIHRRVEMLTDIDQKPVADVVAAVCVGVIGLVHTVIQAALFEILQYVGLGNLKERANNFVATDRHPDQTRPTGTAEDAKQNSFHTIVGLMSEGYLVIFVLRNQAIENSITDIARGLLDPGSVPAGQSGNILRNQSELNPAAPAQPPAEGFLFDRGIGPDIVINVHGGKLQSHRLLKA